MDQYLKPGRIFYTSLTLLTLCMLLTALLTDGTGGGGDTVYHYMYARYAWHQPELFFNHWAKPFFTMVASPFAQLGFKGIKVFNVLMGCFACLFAYKTARLMQLANAHWLFLFLFGTSLFFAVLLSGLTEPLSAFMLMLAVYLWIQDYEKNSLLLISFLPFVRSEGLVLICVFGLYLLITKKYRLLPWLAAGHLIMSVCGYYFYRDILWVFTKIPYASLNSAYGTGNWTHFIDQYYFCSGPIVYGLTIIGGISMVASWFNKKDKGIFYTEKLWLVYGSFVAFILAHTIFWALGIFNSMGLNRVLLTVFPLGAIIATDGLNFILTFIPAMHGNKVLAVILLATCIFPFMHNPASTDFKGYSSPDEKQQLIHDEIVPYLQATYPQYCYVGDVSVALFTHRNPFNPAVFKAVDNVNFVNLSANDIYIWDNWFARVEGHVERADLFSPGFMVQKIFTTHDARGGLIEFIIVTRKSKP